MAQIWIDDSKSMNNIVVDNSVVPLRFQWVFVTFSGEVQDAAQVRWRKAGYENMTIRQISEFPDDIWPVENTVSVGKQPLATGFNIVSVEFPLRFFSAGVWNFQVKYLSGGSWSGWSNTHRIEVSPYSERANINGTNGSQTSLTKGPHATTEGPYGVRVEVVSQAGVYGSSAEQTYNIWDTNKFLKGSDGLLRAVPENTQTPTGIKRVKRTQ